MKRLIVVLGLIFSGAAPASTTRKVYINGTDISGAREQVLKKVDVRISDSGDIFITAPHYQVYEEDSFTPLSAYQKAQEGKETVKPVHKGPEGLSISEPKKLPEAAAPSPNQGAGASSPNQGAGASVGSAAQAQELTPTIKK